MFHRFGKYRNLMWAIPVRMDMPDFSLVQPILSGIYVHLRFPFLFPRIDLERFCLVDTPFQCGVGQNFRDSC